MKLYQDWLLSLSKSFRLRRISNFLTSQIPLYHQTLEQTIRSQSSESKYFRFPIKIAKLDPIISHFNILNKPTKLKLFNNIVYSNFEVKMGFANFSDLKSVETFLRARVRLNKQLLTPTHFIFRKFWSFHEKEHEKLWI